MFFILLIIKTDDYFFKLCTSIVELTVVSKVKVQASLCSKKVVVSRVLYDDFFAGLLLMKELKRAVVYSNLAILELANIQSTLSIRSSMETLTTFSRCSGKHSFKLHLPNGKEK